MIRPEEHATSPEIVAPTGEMETGAEGQATNGAAKHEDAMDVDEEEEVLPAQKAEGSTMAGVVEHP
jgi:hypothetical protein